MLVGDNAVKKCGMLKSHSAVFTQVANSENAVIASRALNLLSEGLLQEGHASKGFYIKSKSCDWGPMAGLLLTKPEFTKDKDKAKQQSYITKALQNAPPRKVFVSTARLKFLQGQGVIHEKSRDASTITMQSSSKHHGTMDFVARKNSLTEPMWQLFYIANKKEEPVMGLVNRPVESAGEQPAGPRGVVAGDYDLFAVWGRHENRRPLGTGPNIVTKGQVAQPYAQAVKNANSVPGMDEDKDMGNVSFYVRTIIKKLNAGIVSKTGYKGGAMIHHNDESGNPFTPGEDYPLIFFVPGKEPRAVESAADLMTIYKECKAAGYCVEVNPGFSVV